MKPSRDTFDNAARNEVHEQDSEWEYGGPPGRYHRSYEALSDVLMAIFENVYLPAEIMGVNPETDELIYTEKGIVRHTELKDRFLLAMKDDDARGRLEIEISPASPKGFISSALSDNYHSGPAEIKAAINTFYIELNEIAAGIPGIAVDPSHHTVSVAGPQAFLDMLEAICNTKRIMTAEKAHAVYALRDREDEEPSKPGHYDHPSVATVNKKPDNDVMAGMRFRRLVGNKNVDASLPRPVFASLAVQPYGLKELGHIINQFNKNGVFAMFSFATLESIVQQDLKGTTTLKDNAAFNIH